ncbi:GntR family transcriptional regulator [Streptomyces sp. NPDC007205]|uniref:GntR family transcriptional regulator n=1 Tax=Streptomyces sp. NPDC007205 TaxID=3154316 RepID=UPI0033E738D3
MSSSKGRTRSDDLYDAVRGDIMGARLRPGERLKFPDLVQRYGTSVGAVREVLARLVGEGLVRSQAHKGFMVTPLSHRDLMELTEARMEAESLVLRRAIHDGDTHYEARAVAAHHVLERTPYLDEADPSHPTEAWSRAHAEFHRALLQGCSNQRLLNVALALRDEAELYRAWSVAYHQEPDRDVVEEHRLLLKYTVERDADAAAEQLRRHLAHTASLLISVATDEPNPQPASESPRNSQRR